MGGEIINCNSAHALNQLIHSMDARGHFCWHRLCKLGPVLCKVSPWHWQATLSNALCRFFIPSLAHTIKTMRAAGSVYQPYVTGVADYHWGPN